MEFSGNFSKGGHTATNAADRVTYSLRWLLLFQVATVTTVFAELHLTKNNPWSYCRQMEQSGWIYIKLSSTKTCVRVQTQNTLHELLPWHAASHNYIAVYFIFYEIGRLFLICDWSMVTAACNASPSGTRFYPLPPSSREAIVICMPMHSSCTATE